MLKNPLYSLHGWLCTLFAIVTFGFISLGLLGLLSSYHGSSTLNALYRGHLLPLNQLQSLNEGYGTKVQNVILYLDAGVMTTREGVDSIRAVQDQVRRDWGAYKQAPHSHREELYIRIVDSLLGFADIEIENTLRYLEIQEEMGHRLLANQLYPIVGSLGPSVSPVLNQIQELSKVHLERAEVEYVQERKRAYLYLFLTGMLVFIGILLGPILGWATLKRIKHQLYQILGVLNGIGKGRLGLRIEGLYHEEFCMIGGGIHQLAQRLRDTLLALRHESKILTQTSLELNSISSHVLDDSKSHILQIKKTASLYREIALRLESALELMQNGDLGKAESQRRLQHSLAAIRNENIPQAVQSLSLIRQTALQSARGMDLLRHKAALLLQMSGQLDSRIGYFDDNC